MPPPLNNLNCCFSNVPPSHLVCVCVCVCVCARALVCVNLVKHSMFLSRGNREMILDSSQKHRCVLFFISLVPNEKEKKTKLPSPRRQTFRVLHRALFSCGTQLLYRPNSRPRIYARCAHIRKSSWPQRPSSSSR